MKKALVVGIDYYAHSSALHGCVADAYKVAAILERHGDKSVNFSVELQTATGTDQLVPKHSMKDKIQELFSGDADIALFYFAGHGHIALTGGYILASDSRRGDDGVSLNEIMVFANASRIKNRIIVLDSCHSGIAGTEPTGELNSILSDGITILTASTSEQYATEQDGAGVFTALLVDALGGAASNLMGDITPGSVYAHIDQSLGPWDQRPFSRLM